MTCNLGEQIRCFRKAKGMSCEELAFRSGLSARGLSNIELGKSSPKFETVERIVNALEISFEDLLNETYPLIIDLVGTSTCSR